MASTTLTTGPLPVFTQGSTSDPTARPMTGTIEGRRAEKARFHVHQESNSGDAEVVVFEQTSNDGVTWAAPSTITGYASYDSTDGWNYGSTWATISDAPFVRFGVFVKNDAATKYDCVRLRLVIDLKYTA